MRLELMMMDIQALLEYRNANVRLQQKIAEMTREHSNTCYALQLKIQAKDEEIARLVHAKALAITEMKHARDRAGKQVEKMRNTVEFMRKWQNEEDNE